MTTKTNNDLTHIDSEVKAYLLGCIAANGAICNEEILVKFNEKNVKNIQKLEDFADSEISIINSENLMFFRITSHDVVNNIKKHLEYSNNFPREIQDNLKWDFLRGFFDSVGTISEVESSYPKCVIESSQDKLLEEIKEFCGVKVQLKLGLCELIGVNALDFLAKLYKDATIYNITNYNLFIQLANCNSQSNRLPMFKWSRTIPKAPKPTKNRFSDSGFDLHLIKKIKVQAGVHYFDTGIQVQPENGYYFDLVGRSSISKTGWMIANNIGIIDSSYTGSIIVALVKIDCDALDLELPCKLVQLIPRRLILMDAVEVNSLEDTERGEKGFGSSN
jgi:dUTP pyrophosphatase